MSGPTRRPYANGPEEKLARLAESKGWKPTKRGWPDFMCIGPDGEIIAIEVKPRTATGRLQLLKREQAACMDFLTAHGVRCYVSDGDVLEKYDHETHAGEAQRRQSRDERKARAAAA